MARSKNSSASGGSRSGPALPIAIGVLVLFSLIPPRFGRFADWIGGTTTGLVAPISHPLSILARKINPPRTGEPGAEVERLLQNELDLALSRVASLEAERDGLLAMMDELYNARQANPDLAIRWVVAPVIASSSDTTTGALRLRAGSRDGIIEGDVAAATVAEPTQGESIGAQLAGRVTLVGPRTCTVRPITDRGAPSFRAVIETGGGASSGVGRSCLLTPTGSALQGPIEYVDNAASVTEGMLVRLRDASWPAPAQGLAVGRVTRVESSDDGPLRKIVTVEPTMDLSNLGRLTFWLDGANAPEETMP